MTALTRHIEEMLLRALAARQTAVLGGWLLRFAAC